MSSYKSDHVPQKHGIPLHQLPIGRWARLTGPLSTSVPRRLLDLGFVPGTRLKIVRRAPFGDPLEIEIRGTRLCFRRSQLRGLRVIPEEQTLVS